MVEVAQSMISNMTRILFDQSLFLRLLANDAAVVAALAVPTPAARITAQARLAQLVRQSGYYRNAFVADAHGDIVISVDRNAAVQTHNVSDAAQYGKAMRSTTADQWYTDEVWRNPWSDNHAVLVYVAGIRPAASEGTPLGVLYLEFDWEGQIGAIVSDRHLFRAVERDRTVVSVVDDDGRVVATSGGYTFGQALPHDLTGTRGSVSQGDSVVAFASAVDFHGFDGLKLRCVIERQVSEDPEGGAIGSAA
ncbi:cache domain-containing protein [Sphingomonas montana]|uniref:cache domain-containing protein n=1 Tax=Sphingomonas montana TaxID=1843236 RepID=UPI003B8397C8